MRKSLYRSKQQQSEYINNIAIIGSYTLDGMINRFFGVEFQPFTYENHNKTYNHCYKALDDSKNFQFKGRE